MSFLVKYMYINSHDEKNISCYLSVTRMCSKLQCGGLFVPVRVKWLEKLNMIKLKLP